MNFKSLLILILKRIFMYSSYVLSIQMIFCASLLASGTSMGQKSQSIKEVEVSVNFENKSIIDAFRQIEDETGFNFIYLKNEIDKKARLTGNYKGTNLYDLLTNISKETDLTFHRVNNSINVKKVVDNRKSSISESMEDVGITGKVTDENGQGLPGASVVIKGTSRGTTTNIEGDYKLSVPEGAVLTISFVGYTTQEMIVGAESVIDVKMELDAEHLEEVVVVGYGVQKKANLTGAVDNINFEEKIGIRPVGNISQMLQGALPNVNFATNNDGGEPGAALNINVRGRGTVTGDGGSPYILLDGIPISSSQMNSINPYDVKEITILKDAASAAIYGARGSFGVILITTKKGTKDRIGVTYSNNIASSSPVSLPKMASSLEYVNALNDAYANEGRLPAWDDDEIQVLKDYQNGLIPFESGPNDNNDGWRGWGNRDWFDEFYTSSLRTTHNLSVSGGTDKTSYYLSGNFYDQSGNFTFADDRYKRNNFTVNLTNKTTDWISFDISAKYSRQSTVFPSGGFESFDKDILYHQISRTRPTNALYSPDGQIINANVKRMQSSGETTEFKSRTMLTLGTDIEPVKNWVTRISYNWTTDNRNRVVEQFKNFIENPDGTLDNVGYNQNSVAREMTEDTDRLINIVSRYNKAIEYHNFGLMVGYEQRLNKELEFEGFRADLITSSLPTFSTATGTQSVDDRLFQYSTQGVFGRFSYDFNSKYLFEANLRYDGSSFFREGNRWGLFPSFSVGYNLAREDFWAPLENTVSQFKIRSSWGSLGNHDPRLASRYLELMGSSQSSWIINGQKSTIVTAPSLISPDLSWETSTTLDIGFDATMFERLQINFDWYNRVTSDMVGPSLSLPAVLGTSAPQRNNAKMGTKGWELVLDWKGTIGEVGYSIGTNLSDNKSTILSYPNTIKSYDFGNATLDDWFPGQVVDDIYGLTTVGLYQTDQEAAEGPDQSLFWNEWRAGDVQYADLDGNGIIDEGDGDKEDDKLGDISVIGNKNPRYTYGLNLGASYKGFQLSILLQGVAKRDLSFRNNTNLFWGFRNSETQSTIHKPALDYWRPDNTDAYFSRPYFSNQQLKNTRHQTRYLQSGAYMRVKNIQLSYSLPESLMSKWGVNRIQVYVSGENLLTFTKLQKTLDPETVGGFYGSGKIYPLQRVLSAGMHISF